MTGVAAHTLINVNAVIEVHEVRNLVDARPFDRSTAPEALADGFQVSRIGPDLRMAVHAGLGGRNAREARLYRRVTGIDSNPESVTDADG